jgi:hypothetical protein
MLRCSLPDSTAPRGGYRLCPQKRSQTHLLWLSWLCRLLGNQETVAHVMRAHIDTEQYLQHMISKISGFTFIVIREGLYTESYPGYTAFFDPRNPSSEVKITHDGGGPGIAWVKREELGEGTAELIKRFVDDQNRFQYLNSTVLLSGPKVLTLAETVSVFGKIATTPVEIRNVSVEEYAAQPINKDFLTYKGYDYSTLWASSFEAIRQGEACFVTPLLAELLGRAPEEFEKTVSNQRSTTRSRFGA